MRSAWAWVKQARGASDLIESDVAAGTIATFDATTSDARWPAPLA